MSNQETNNVFKVPKIKTKEILHRVSLTSDQYKSDILPIIVSNFKKPSISEKMMKITAAWIINNSAAEERHCICRKKMRKTMPMLSYSVGFIFLNTVSQLQKIAKSGEIVNGNITDSHLATSNFGVSLCQFADIYHSGNKNGGVPNSGFLLIVKYLKGKINYVPCDPLPMDPQPDFDCHMVKNPVIDNNMCCSKAFHNSQIFIYEYTEDGEIINCPSQILPFAAIKFTWEGYYLFKRTETSIRKTLTVIHERTQTVKESHSLVENQEHLANVTIHQRNASSIIPFVLCIKGLSNVELKSNAYLYLAIPVISLLRSDANWQMSGVIEISEFEKEFKQLQINWNNLISPKSSKDLLDPLSQDLIISLNRPNLLSSAGTNSESLSFNKSLNTPQFVTYTRIVLNSFDYSIWLIKYLNITKSMGFINRQHDPDISILIFPDGNISRKLGIPSVDDNYYFHGLIFHSQHPQFIILDNPIEKKREKDIYFSCLSTLKKQSIQSKLNTLLPIIDKEIFQQTLKSQIEVQKTFLFNLVKPQTIKRNIIYKPICFDTACLNQECWFHNPIKKPRLIEITNTEKISNEKSSPIIVPKKKRKIIEQKCLSEKLFDYFKNKSNETTDHTKNVTDDLLTKDIGSTIQNISILDNVNEKIEQANILCNIANVSLSDKFVSISNECTELETTENIYLVDCYEKVQEFIELHDEEIIINYKETNIQRNVLHFQENDQGLFHSLNFKSYDRAEYSNNGIPNSFQFKNQMSSCFVDKRRDSTKDMWLFHSLPFKRIKNWPGASVYT